MATTDYYETLLQEDLNTGVGTATKRAPGGGNLSGTQIGVHTFAVGQAAGSKTWDPDSVASGSSTSTTLTVSGAALGDFVLASFSLSLQGMSISAYVSDTNTVTVVLNNNSGSAVDLASGTLKALVFKSR